MVHKKIKIDTLVSSTAVRAFTTATYFAKAYNKSINQILQEPSLYHAPPSVFYSVITQLNNSFNSVAIFAHNPGITQFVNQLTPAQIDDMPTCGIFAIESNIDDWKAFNTRNNKFLFFISPKSTS
jgi:phosphohistidine phosphatase